MREGRGSQGNCRHLGNVATLLSMRTRASSPTSWYPRGRTKQTLSPGSQSVQKSSLLLSPHQVPSPSLLHSLEVSLHNLLHDGASLCPVPSGACTALDYGLKSPQEQESGLGQVFPGWRGSFTLAHPEHIHINRYALSTPDQEKQKRQLILD